MALFKSREEKEKEKKTKDVLADQERKRQELFKKKVENCLITTTNTVEGYVVENYHGTVSGFSILKLDILQEFFANVGDFWGGKSKRYAKMFNDLQNDVEMKLKLLSVEKGGNAIVGTSFDVEFIETSTGAKRILSDKDVIERKLMISGSGTSVTIRKKGDT